MAEHQVSVELYEAGAKWCGPNQPCHVIGVLDLMKGGDLPIAMNFQVKDINNLDENTAAFTKTFDIPATRHNNKVLEECFTANLVEYQKFVGDRIKCNVKVNGLTVLQGSFQVTSIMEKDKVIGYTCTVLGDANNWVSEFEKPMCETRWDNVDETIYDNNTGAGNYTFSSHMWKLLNDNVTNSDDHTWCMPQICWGAYSHTQTNAGGTQTRAKMWLEDNVPSIFIKPLVETYFNELGYTLESEFMDTDYFKKLCFPLDKQYFRHGYGQEPVYHVEARFEPPNVNDPMWNDISGNGFENREMFGMFMLVPIGDRWQRFGSIYAEMFGGGFSGRQWQPSWVIGSHTNFNNWSSWDITGGGDFTNIGVLEASNWVAETINQSGSLAGFSSLEDGRWGLDRNDGNVQNGVGTGLIGGNETPPWAGHLGMDDMNPDTAHDGTVEFQPINASCMRIPFNHMIVDNGKGSIDGAFGRQWAVEALVNFQPPFGDGGGGLDPDDWIHTTTVLIFPQMCGTYGRGVQFMHRYGDDVKPYFIDSYPYLENGVFGLAAPYHQNAAWYGVYNGWGYNLTQLLSGNFTTDDPTAHLGTSQWNRSVVANGQGMPVSCNINSSLQKWQGYPHAGWTNSDGAIAEWRKRNYCGTSFFSWVAPSEGKYRFEILVPVMFENIERPKEYQRPTLRVLRAEKDTIDMQEVEIESKRVLNWKPVYENGKGMMVYHEFKIDTGFISCKQYDRICVDIMCGSSYMRFYEDKNACIMLSSEFARRLNSTSATDPFIWDDYCDGDSGNDGRIVAESFPMNAETGEYVIPNGYFKCFQDDTVRHMDKFNLRDMLPCDVTKMEFIGGLTGLFNLHWHTNEQSKTVSVEPFDTFYRGKKDAVDWTYKQDFSTEAITSFMTDRLAKEIVFAYQEDSGDGMVDVISARNNQHWHSHEIELSDTFLNEQIILGTSLFAPTYMIEDFELKYGFGGGQAPWIPIIVSDYEDDIGYLTPKPDVSDGFLFRLLSYEGMQSVGMQTCYGSWHWNIPHPITGVNGDVSTYPQAVSWHYNSASAANLSYSQSNNDAFPQTSGIQDGLYHTYWKGMMTMLASSPRTKTAYFYLTPSDIAKLDLRNIVHTTDHGGGNAQYWIVSKVVDYQPHLDEPTAVELIQYQISTTDKGIVAHNDDTVSTIFNGGSHDTNDQPASSIRQTNSSINQGNASTGVVRTVDNNNGMHHGSVRTVMQRNVGNDAPRNAGIAMFGHNLISRREGQVVLGQFNRRDDNAILVVGGGSSVNDRRNLITVREDGQIEFGAEGGGTNLVTQDENGNYVDMFTEIPIRNGEVTVIKVIK